MGRRRLFKAFGGNRSALEMRLSKNTIGCGPGPERMGQVQEKACSNVGYSGKGSFSVTGASIIKSSKAE